MNMDFKLEIVVILGAKCAKKDVEDSKCKTDVLKRF